MAAPNRLSSLLGSSKRRERLNEACKEQLRSAPPRTHEQEQAVIDRLFEELTPEERNLLLLRAIQQYPMNPQLRDMSSPQDS